ncbi:MAG: LytTR family DNA-binding domain-containing protein [Psychroserpens sp.]|uniref:LytR/AlgR family response regulator transcription factor n=1 Tax=Psychroserpens sp. TaxID=2020870 RepID=UPI003003774C
MKQLNCLIIDDEPLAREGLKTYCDNLSFLNIVALCKNALQANEHLHNNDIDLIFLDINMPIISGIDWLKTLDKSPLVVMTTAYTEYALESFSFEVLDYLVKPISFERFLQAVNKVLRFSNNIDNYDLFFVKSNNVLKKVLINDILYIEAMQNYMKIITTNDTIVAHTTLKELKDNLPSSNFIQTHKSFIISKSQVDKIVGNLIVIGNHKIPISVRMRKDVLGQFT